MPIVTEILPDDELSVLSLIQDELFILSFRKKYIYFEFSLSCHVEMYICGWTGSQKAVLLLVFEYTDYDIQLILLLIKTHIIMYLSNADVPRRKKATVEFIPVFVILNSSFASCLCITCLDSEYTTSANFGLIFFALSSHLIFLTHAMCHVSLYNL
jgi:hypothetical protein